jgi:hypothetical protein
VTGSRLGTAAAQRDDFDAAGAAAAAQAYAVQRGNHTGTQPASTVTGLATVATTGNTVDLVGNPFSFLTTGQETFPRMLINTASISATSGTARFTYFTARKSETVTQIRALCLNASAGTAPTLVRFGLYSVNSSTGALTLIASTANDTTVFASTGSTAFTKAFTAGVALTAGTRYAVTHLVVTTGTAPSVMGYGSGLGLSSESAMSPRIVGALTTQTDLPSSVTDAALGNSSTSATYYVLLP